MPAHKPSELLHIIKDLLSDFKSSNAYISFGAFMNKSVYRRYEFWNINLFIHTRAVINARTIVTTYHKRRLDIWRGTFWKSVMWANFNQLKKPSSICNVLSQIMPQIMLSHYSDIMGAMASQVTGVLIVCLTVCSDGDQLKYQSSVPLTFVSEIHRWLVDSFTKGQ